MTLFNILSLPQGTHECLQGDTKAMATVTAIIDGTGSFGKKQSVDLTRVDFR